MNIFDSEHVFCCVAYSWRRRRSRIIFHLSKWRFDSLLSHVSTAMFIIGILNRGAILVRSKIRHCRCRKYMANVERNQFLDTYISRRSPRQLRLGYFKRIRIKANSYKCETDFMITWYNRLGYGIQLTYFFLSKILTALAFSHTVCS